MHRSLCRSSLELGNEELKNPTYSGKGTTKSVTSNDENNIIENVIIRLKNIMFQVASFILLSFFRRTLLSPDRPGV